MLLFEEAPSFTKKFVHRFVSLRVWQTMTLLWRMSSYMSWMDTAWTQYFTAVPLMRFMQRESK